MVERARHHEDNDCLALDLVRHTDRRRFGHGRMGDRGGLDLGRPDTLAGDLQRVVAPPFDVPVALVVDARPVAMHPRVLEARPIRPEVAAVLRLPISPEPARHPRPWLANDKLADSTPHRSSVLVHDVRSHSRAWPDE